MVDVTVMGAGIFGLSVALACAERGAKVRLVDPNGIAAGASGGVVGALAPHVPENWNPKKAFQLESLLMAETFWSRIETLSGRPTGYARLGRVQPLMDAHAIDLARQREGTAAEMWRDIATWRVAPSDPDTAWAPRSPTGFCLHDDLSARLPPGRACNSLYSALNRQFGIAIAREAEQSGRVLWATGHEGLRHLSEVFGRPVGSGVKGQAAVLQHDVRGAPQIYADGLYLVPHADGTVAVGSTSEREFDDPAATDAQLDDIVRRARAVCPALAGAPVLRRWAGVRPRARTRAPVLGPWPGRPGHFIANGGFKIGFGMAPKVAEVMADLMLEDRDTIPDGFRVEDCL